MIGDGPPVCGSVALGESTDPAATDDPPLEVVPEVFEPEALEPEALEPDVDADVDVVEVEVSDPAAATVNAEVTVTCWPVAFERPVAVTWCSPTGRSAGILKVIVATPSALALLVPKSIGVEL